jgi:chemotaxis protein histidine kinase CheA
MICWRNSSPKHVKCWRPRRRDRRLGANPADRARLDTIFRFVHTVKGNCGFFDFPQLESLSHAAEDALSDVRAGRRQPDSRLVDAVLAVIDRIGVMIAEIERGEPLSEAADDVLIAALAGALDENEPGDRQHRRGRIQRSAHPAPSSARSACRSS